MCVCLSDDEALEMPCYFYAVFVPAWLPASGGNVRRFGAEVWLGIVYHNSDAPLA